MSDDEADEAELLAELRARDARIEQLRLERDAFSKNFELLKEADVELKHDLDNTRREVSPRDSCARQLPAAGSPPPPPSAARPTDDGRASMQLAHVRDEKTTIQRRYEEQSNHLRKQLDAQKREFEETKKRLVPPREFEMLRIRLIEELEVPYRNRFEQLQQELELSREQFYAQRRETGVLREEFESMASVHVKELESLRDEYELKLSELRTRLRSMQALADDTTDKERFAAFYRENIALKANTKHLLAELEDVRKAKEEAVIDRERAGAAAAKAVADEVMQARTLLLQKEQLERRCAHLEQKFGEGPQESFEQQMARLQDEADAHRVKQEEMANVLGAERNAMNARLLEKEREHSQHEAEMSAELSAAKARVEELKEDIVRAERMYQSQRQSLLNEFEEERGRMQQSAEAMSREVEQAAMTVAELDAAKVEQVTGAEEQLAAVEAEARRTAGELAELESEKNEADLEIEKLRARVESLQHESAGRATALDDVHKERASLEEQHEKATETHQTLHAAAKSAVAEIDKRRRAQAKERSAWAAKVDSLKRAVGREHELHKAAVAQGEANKKKAKQEVGKLKHQVKMLMAQLQQRQHGERNKLGPLDANIGGGGAAGVKPGHVSDADSGGFSDADAAGRR